VLLRKQEPRVIKVVACDSGLLLSQEHGNLPRFPQHNDPLGLALPIAHSR